MTAGVSRTDHDSMGPIQVPADRYWGPQTQRSIEHFPIGRDRFVFGRPMIEALGLVKRTAATVNEELGLLEPRLAEAIRRAADEVVDGRLDDHFPLVVFQTGSGTQTNMNANEVIANRANELLGGRPGSNDPVHPNDHVNRGQSSNDVFPTAMYVATLLMLDRRLYPPVQQLLSTLDAKAGEFADLVKVGRTHLQDATPITLGQEIGAWVAQIGDAIEGVRTSAAGLRHLAIGGTAVGTGLNTHPEFAARMAAGLGESTGIELVPATNPFAALASHDALVAVSGSLRILAGAFMKMANDVRWLASGPRNGIGELLIPENEPGSSIMPGKVNPTQCEALTMVSVQVFGNDVSVALAGTQGNFQLNVYKPIMVHNVLESIGLLGEGSDAFDRHLAIGLEPDRDRIAANLESNLMLVTALARHIGYDAAASIAKSALETGRSLRVVATEQGDVTPADFDRWVVPLDMTHPG